MGYVNFPVKCSVQRSAAQSALRNALCDAPRKETAPASSAVKRGGHADVFQGSCGHDQGVDQVIKDVIKDVIRGAPTARAPGCSVTVAQLDSDIDSDIDLDKGSDQSPARCTKTRRTGADGRDPARMGY